MKKILFITSEIYPLIKAGGLGDFSYSFTHALQQNHFEPLVLVPGYQDLIDKLEMPDVIFEFGDPCSTRILESIVPESNVTLWVVDCPSLFGFHGSPYTDKEGNERTDVAIRFAHFCRIATEVAMDHIQQDWKPDIAHCNDWPCGLVPAFLSTCLNPPASVFTIHNLGYQGNFPAHYFDLLDIPVAWRNYQCLEFYNQLSFIKGGLVFAHELTTVSPGYAAEIQTPEYGCGMQELIASRREQLRGILNGVDYDLWNPASDDLIKVHYDSEHLEDKAKNKLALQKECGLPKGKSCFLVSFIGRLASQKGIELLIEAIRNNIDNNLQWIVLGCGLKHYERALNELAQQYPEKVSVHTTYDEALAHRIEAGADAFLMPSYYEPCGLNQIYSLKYGTIPIVSQTGGLADSICNMDKASLENNTATGFLFGKGNSAEMLATVETAAAIFKKKAVWQQLQRKAMEQDFSWESAIKDYVEVYEAALARPAARP
jgi:starch synthase